MVRKHEHRCRKVLVSINIGSQPGRDVLSGIFKYINAGHNWSLHFVQLTENAMPNLDFKCLDASFDGIITDLPNSRQQTEALMRYPKPKVLTSFRSDVGYRKIKNASFLRLDEPAIAATAARHLLSQGKFKSFAFTGDSIPSKWSTRRRLGFVHEIEKAGYKAFVFSKLKDASKDCNLRELAQWLKKLPKPAAVMTSYDYMSVRVIECCRAVGIRIPGQIALIGVDDDELICKNTTPSLSSVRPNHVELGRRAAEELDLLMQGKSAGRRIVIAGGGEVVERESTRRVPPAGALVEHAITLINQNVNSRITPADIARRLHVSRRLIDLRFHEIKGYTLQSAIDKARLSEVLRRLENPQNRIHQIARECGFSSPNRLSHFFQRKTGMSMREWRRRCQA